MTSGQEDTYSYDLTALTDYELQTIPTAPPTVGVGGGRLNTPPPPSTSMSSGIGVGTTNTSPSILSNVTVGVGGTRPTVGYKTPVRRRSPKGKQPAARATKGGKEPRHTARQNTPSSPSDAGSLRRSSASGSDSGRSGSSRSGGSRRGGGGGGGGRGSRGSGGGDDDDHDDTPLGVPGPSNCRARRRILNDQEMEQQLAQILQDQRQMAAGQRIAGITTTNTITTTY